MNSSVAKVLATAAVLVGLVSTTAQAQQDRQLPKSWGYDVNQRGQRVNRANRVTQPDGSWREEVRQGNCVTIKERSATGEYRESRQCNPTSPAKPQ